jgi:glycosyltransferase involved in cell wall biosynthesis
MKKLNILIVTEVFFPDTVGGSGRVVYEVSKYLARRGHNVYLLTPRLNNKLSREEFLEGFWIYRYSGVSFLR